MLGRCGVSFGTAYRCSKLSFEENQVRVRGFDRGKHRSSFEAEVPIGQARALLESCLLCSRLRVAPRALRHAALEASVTAELCTDAKEGTRNAPVGELTTRGTPTIQRSTASPSVSAARFASYASSTVISASAIGRNQGNSTGTP